MKSYFYHIPYTKINLKWISNLNIRAKIIELAGENIGVNLEDHWISQWIIRYDTEARTRNVKNR